MHVLLHTLVPLVLVITLFLIFSTSTLAYSQFRKHNMATKWERNCEGCNKDMIILSEGDFIFDSKWHHKDCGDEITNTGC